MENRYLTYLDLLEELGTSLEQLTALAQQKVEAVRKDDLTALDEILKQEQVFALSLRGLEQRRIKQIGELGLTDTTLSQLPGAYPNELQYQARQRVEKLRQQYGIYQSASEVVRHTLECNLHEIEKVIAAQGAGQAPGGAGYASSEPEPPQRMKTDFRA